MHGGAWSVPRAAEAPGFGASARDGLLAALAAGGGVLEAGGSALDAVIAAVRELEDCPALNAGRGAVRNAAGQVELDAAVMEGSARRAGAVACLRRVANPVEAARAVLEDGRHVLLVGEGAERLAARAGIALVAAEQLTAAGREPLVQDGPADTVGAVARDARGALAAATSTGGTPGKQPGRVSDSALVGSGTWADDASCAVSATGEGEYFIRSAFARAVDAWLRLGGCDLAGACSRALAEIESLGGRGGCIAVDRGGAIALPFTTPGMLRGLLRQGEPPRVAVHPEDAL